MAEPIEGIILDGGGAVYNTLNSTYSLVGLDGKPVEIWAARDDHDDSEPIDALIKQYIVKNGGGFLFFSSCRDVVVAKENDQDVNPDGGYRIKKDLLIPKEVTCQFASGARLEVFAGVTVTIECPLMVELQQIITCREPTKEQADLGIKRGVVKFAGGTVPHLYPQWWGALGDGIHDDTDAIQAAIEAVPVLGQEFGGEFAANTAKMSVILPSPPNYYRTTRAIYVHLHHFLLAGEAPGVPIVLDAANAVPIADANKPSINNDVLWIKTDEKAASGQVNPGLFTGWDEQPSPRQALRNVTIENLNLSSTHPGSNAGSAAARHESGPMTIRVVTRYGPANGPAREMAEQFEVDPGGGGR